MDKKVLRGALMLLVTSGILFVAGCSEQRSSCQCGCGKEGCECGSSAQQKPSRRAYDDEEREGRAVRDWATYKTINRGNGGFGF